MCRVGDENVSSVKCCRSRNSKAHRQATTAVLWPTEAAFGDALQKIVVTAQKRDWTAQDIPIAANVDHSGWIALELDPAGDRHGPKAGRCARGGCGGIGSRSTEVGGDPVAEIATSQVNAAATVLMFDRQQHADRIERRRWKQAAALVVHQ